MLLQQAAAHVQAAAAQLHADISSSDEATQRIRTGDHMVQMVPDRSTKLQ